MKAPKLKYLTDPIFGFHFLVVVGGKESDAMRKFCRTFGFEYPEIQLDTNRGSFSHNDKSPYCGLIWLENGASAATMAHEAAHATAHVCRVLDLDPREADEFQASYTGWLVRELNKLYWRKNR